MKYFASFAPLSLKGLCLLAGLSGVAALNFSVQHAVAQDQATLKSKDQVGQTLGSIQVIDESFTDLIDADAEIEILGGGYEWSEGPVWVPAEKRLLFSDIPNNAIMQWNDGEGVTVAEKRVGYTGDPKEGGREPGTNGLFLSPDGQLYACCHGDRCIKRKKADGSWEVVIDKYDGKRFNSPNDLAFHSNGDLYFTDPPYGLPAGQERELDWCGVYRWNGKEVTLLTKEFNRPNGIGFSPDYKTLYVAQSDGSAPIWKAFALKADGTLEEGKELATAKEFYGKVPGSPDGMTVDEKGNLWVTAPGGVWVISAQGKVLGKILTGQATANCTFGGPDRSWLMITADMYLCRVKTKTKGMK